MLNLYSIFLFTFSFLLFILIRARPLRGQAIRLYLFLRPMMAPQFIEVPNGAQEKDTASVLRARSHYRPVSVFPGTNKAFIAIHKAIIARNEAICVR